VRYLPHTDEDVAKMLAVVGKPSLAALFEHIPERLRTRRPVDIEPLDEGRLLQHLGELGAHNLPAVGATPRDGAGLSFLGAGLVPHTIPSAVDALLMRSEWYTSYTPYQPEISQGTLQAVFEFQTICAELLGLDVANASMYDGASAAAEGALMAQRVTDRGRVVLAGAVHPHHARTIDTYLDGHGGKPTRVGWDEAGRVDRAALDAALSDDVAAVVVMTPNFFGVVEDLRPLAEAARRRGALLVVASAEPVAFGLVAPPGALGADIAVAEGIGLAIPPSLGGPGVGLFAARQELVRQMPGRLVGETVDKEGKRGYVLTLATREQHIRREKATSNICTNQGLIALAFSIHLSLLGRRGFHELARLNLAKAQYARAQLTAVEGVRAAFSGPSFNELALRLPRPAAEVVERLAGRGILAGVPATAPGLLEDAALDDVLLVAVTERHQKSDLERFARALSEAIRE
jgi:glycine dehydrogenase subunit 1